MKKMSSEKGAISVIVLITILFFITILTGTYLINANIRKAQIKSQVQIKNEYEKFTTNEMKSEIYNEINNRVN